MQYFTDQCHLSSITLKITITMILTDVLCLNLIEYQRELIKETKCIFIGNIFQLNQPNRKTEVVNKYL